MNFPVVYDDILNKVNAINPIEYSHTRNYIHGDVSYLSPYISRGVISTKQVLEAVLSKGHKAEQIEKFIQQLAWREYFQRVWQQMGDDMFDDIRQCYTGIKHRNIPTAIAYANTGIHSIDNAINEFYKSGYLHNHLRMYIASITCNIGKSYWQVPSKWMYYNLLDGDLANNTCSWQWVAGHFSSKQYYCNQENINKYTYSKQQNTFLDKGYDELPEMAIPKELTDTVSLKLNTVLPEKKIPEIDVRLPLLIYNSYNLDPLWRQDIKANRILLLEPSHFKQHPVNDKVINFILSLSKNIPDLQVFKGEVSEIPCINQFPVIYSKEHPAFNYYPGNKDEREWLFPEIKTFHNSFFSFWKKCKRHLKLIDKITKEPLRA
jgi:deoxyribodipyrimidine photo-lyase